MQLVSRAAPEPEADGGLPLPATRVTADSRMGLMVGHHIQPLYTPYTPPYMPYTPPIHPLHTLYAPCTPLYMSYTPPINALYTPIYPPYTPQTCYPGEGACSSQLRCAFINTLISQHLDCYHASRSLYSMTKCVKVLRATQSKAKHGPITGSA